MNMAQIGTASLSLALLAGCASDWQRSYRRWYDYKASSGPYTRWALCIDQRSAHHIAPAGVGPIPDSGDGNRGLLFTRVLEDCRQFMSGPAWDNLPADHLERLISDAYQAFVVEDAEALARMEASISMETPN